MAGKPKLTISRQELLRILKVCNFEKLRTAEKLGVDEATVRRLCRRLKIDTTKERESFLRQTELVSSYPTTPSSRSNKSSRKGTFVAIPDLHARNAIWSHLEKLALFISDFRPQYIIQLGDAMDYECLYGIHRQKNPFIFGRDIHTLDMEFQALARIVRLLNSVSPRDSEKFLLKGNHEYRADRLIERLPEFHSLVSLDNHIDLAGWKVLPYLKPLKLGKLHFIHGEFYGVSPVRKHLQVYQKNIIFGHTHRIEQSTMASPVREIPVWGASIGCLCNLNPDYLRNRSNAFDNGFAYGYIDSNGDFDCAIVRIVRNRFRAEGRLYS